VSYIDPLHVVVDLFSLFFGYVSGWVATFTDELMKKRVISIR